MGADAGRGSSSSSRGSDSSESLNCESNCIIKMPIKNDGPWKLAKSAKRRRSRRSSRSSQSSSFEAFEVVEVNRKNHGPKQHDNMERQSAEFNQQQPRRRPRPCPRSLAHRPQLTCWSTLYCEIPRAKIARVMPMKTNHQRI